MSEAKYRLLAPASRASKPTSSESIERDRGSLSLVRRHHIRVACYECRKRKSKCDGARPTCKVCLKQAKICEYDRDPEETQIVALVKKQRAASAENDKLRRLYDLLHSRPELEAAEIFQLLRTTKDPLLLLQFLEESVLPVQMPAEHDVAHRDPRVEKVDAGFLANSALKVHARPWTTVAGDGLVSDLITSFFMWDSTFYFSFVDMQRFLADMAQGCPEEAKYCSPLLVNAICCIRSVSQ